MTILESGTDEPPGLKVTGQHQKGLRVDPTCEAQAGPREISNDTMPEGVGLFQT